MINKSAGKSLCKSVNKLTIFIYCFTALLLLSANSFGYDSGLKNEILYYIIVDRFYDGNEDNNIPNWAYPVSEEIEKEDPRLYEFNRKNRSWLKKMYDPTQREYQHYLGGDLQGIIDKLDYLSDLGITAILISPIFENVNGLFYNNGNTAYHGYWAKDWFRIDEHFANPPQEGDTIHDSLSGEKIITELITRAKERGIKVLLDLSLNHTSPVETHLALDRSITPDDYYYLEFSPWNKNGEHINHYCYPTKTEPCRDNFDDSGWYNPDMAITDWDDPIEVEKGKIHSLPDINQRHPEVQNYFLEMAKKWLDLGFSGFRIDAVKHIYKDYLAKLEKDLMEYQESRGRELILIGEFFDGGVRNKTAVEWMKNSSKYTMFDFSFAASSRLFFAGETDNVGTMPHLQELAERVEGVYHPKNTLGYHSDHLITFLNNHDIPRMKTVAGVTHNQYLAALKFMMVSRGIPKLNYGDEIGQALSYNKKYKSILGIGGDPWCRVPMKWEHSKEEKEMFEVTKNLIALRKKYTVLRYGDTRFIKPHGIWDRMRNGVFGYPYLAMERSLKQGEEAEAEYLYYFFSRKKQTIHFKVNLPDGKYSDAVSGDGKIYSVEDGVIELEMDADQAVIVSNPG